MYIDITVYSTPPFFSFMPYHVILIYFVSSVLPILPKSLSSCPLFLSSKCLLNFSSHFPCITISFTNLARWVLMEKKKESFQKSVNNPHIFLEKSTPPLFNFLAQNTLVQISFFHAAKIDFRMKTDGRMCPKVCENRIFGCG